MKTPHGYEEVIATFGDPSKFRNGDGTLSSKWEETYITRIVLPQPLAWGEGGKVTKIAVHKALGEILSDTLAEVLAAGMWDELSPYGGGFEPRLKRGSSKVSLHTFGIALDFAPDRYSLGSSERMPARLVEIFRSHGWFYGGDFHGRLDPMHFQYATGC